MASLGSKSPKNTSKATQQRNQLGFETLERREMLSANMGAEIAGVVRTDLQGSRRSTETAAMASSAATTRQSVRPSLPIAMADTSSIR